jgi:hypothetical protein
VGDLVKWSRGEKAKHVTCPQKTTDTSNELSSGERKISIGEGYGGRPFQVGSTISVRNRETGRVEPMTVKKAWSKYFSEDGLSFGVGDDSGYIYYAIVAPPTPDEIQAYQLQLNRTQEKKDLERLRTQVANEIRDSGEFPPGENEPEGKIYSSTQTRYGEGDWFVIGPQWIWYVLNNGSDWVHWRHNNVLTGGAGALGWRVPYTEDLAEKIKKFSSLEKRAGKASEEIQGREASKRTSRGTPRLGAQFPAEYPGRCSSCGHPIKVGDLVEWSSGGKIKHVTCPQKTTDTSNEPSSGERKISIGEGYGGTPFQVGSVISVRNKETGVVKPMTVKKAWSKYFSEDGLSFGVGDDSGYIYYAIVAPPTPDEIQAYQLQLNRTQEKKDLERLRTQVANEIRDSGEFPPGENEPEGKIYSSTQTRYGEGDWFVIGPQWIWYVLNNGSDWVHWRHNNVLTGGAGALGWRVPYTEDLAEKIKKFSSLEKRAGYNLTYNPRIGYVGLEKVESGIGREEWGGFKASQSRKADPTLNEKLEHYIEYLSPNDDLTGYYVCPDGWGPPSGGDKLLPSDWEQARYRLPVHAPGGIKSIAVNVTVTGTPQRKWGGIWQRVKIEFVGDGEPSEVSRGWVLVSPYHTEGRRASRRATHMRFWDVLVGEKVIDSVPFEDDMDEEEVYRSLVDHDGYSPDITVVPSSSRTTPFLGPEQVDRWSEYAEGMPYPTHMASKPKRLTVRWTKGYQKGTVPPEDKEQFEDDFQAEQSEHHPGKVFPASRRGGFSDPIWGEMEEKAKKVGALTGKIYNLIYDLHQDLPEDAPAEYQLKFRQLLNYVNRLSDLTLVWTRSPGWETLGPETDEEQMPEIWGSQRGGSPRAKRRSYRPTTHIPREMHAYGFSESDIELLLSFHGGLFSPLYSIGSRLYSFLEDLQDGKKPKISPFTPDQVQDAIKELQRHREYIESHPEDTESGTVQEVDYLVRKLVSLSGMIQKKDKNETL